MARPKARPMPESEIPAEEGGTPTFEPEGYGAPRRGEAEWQPNGGARTPSRDADPPDGDFERGPRPVEGDGDGRPD